MFVQVMQGRVRDEEGLRKQIDRWLSDLMPGAGGWLGMTGGIASDGEFIGVVRFESAEAARANSNRPEQGEWWTETAGSFEGDVTFIDCPEVDLFLEGGSDEAGFVQIIQGRADREELRRRAPELDATLRRLRPDVIGGLVAWHGDGRFTQTVYFVNEAEARAGETRQFSREDVAARDEVLSLLKEVRYVDLRDPWIFSP
jgi:hypothetical protein